MPLLLLLAALSPVLAGSLWALNKPVPVVAYAGQCSVCGGVFEGWNGGICDACKNTNHS